MDDIALKKINAFWSVEDFKRERAMKRDGLIDLPGPTTGVFGLGG